METQTKLFNQKAISIATYIGGPMAAGYLVKRNFDALDEPKKGLISVIVGIISTIFLFVGIFSIPEHIIDKIPNVLIPAIYTGAIYLIVERLQGKAISEHEANKEAFHSNWVAGGIGLVSALILALTAFATFMSTDFMGLNTEFDVVAYDKGISQIAQNEEKALTVFTHDDFTNNSYMANEFATAAEYWHENKQILQELDRIDDLPAELVQQNRLLQEYCDLRLEEYNLYIKAFAEDTDSYEGVIMSVEARIEALIAKLSGNTD